MKKKLTLIAVGAAIVFGLVVAAMLLPVNEILGREGAPAATKAEIVFEQTTWTDIPIVETGKYAEQILQQQQRFAEANDVTLERIKFIQYNETMVVQYRATDSSGEPSILTLVFTYDYELDAFVISEANVLTYAAFEALIN